MGTVVRVPLHGRRVRGWVLATDVEPATTRDRLLPLLAVASAGPPAEVVELCTWAAWRWAGPRVAFLRAATAPNRVVGAAGEPDIAVYPERDPGLPLGRADRRVLRWPPARSRDDLLRGLVAPEGSTVVVGPDPTELDRLERALTDEGRRVWRWESDRSGAERTAAWAGARSGACVVLGGRIAAFAPVPDLRAAVVLDDADEALVEERAPAWNASDVLRERAERSGARFDVVSPLPTVEALVAAEATTPGAVVERDGWPIVEVADLRDEPPGTGILSTRLGPALHRALDAGARCVCVLNRKGRARLLACRSCGELARCARCDAAVSEIDGQLVCGRCATVRDVSCLHDGGIRFRVVRPGVGRAREELAALVPRATVVAVESASAPLPAFDVAVGTEAVLHRIPADGRPVGLVAFLELDQELLAPRYRAAEQAAWLVVRAARLVGPRTGPGRLLLQTRSPADAVVTAAVTGDPTAVLDAERGRRERLRFPPFGGLAEVSGADEAVATACVALAEHVEVLGPERGRALLRAPTVAALCDALAAVDLAPARAAGRLRVEVDPRRV